MVHELHVESAPFNGVEILTLTGAVEQVSFPSLAGTIARSLHEQSPRLVLDCRGVKYIGSTQLRELLEFMAYARTLGGDIKFAALAPAIRTVAFGNDRISRRIGSGIPPAFAISPRNPSSSCFFGNCPCQSRYAVSSNVDFSASSWIG